MYRVIFIIIAVLAIALGLLIGTLNSDSVSFDLLWVQLQWPLGLLMLGVFAVGLLAGLLLAWVFGIMPLRVRLRRSGGKESQRTDG
ncbi:lipopolysaccharide assembly protein LapA domain-containing protein [Pseudomonadota bacterium]